MDLKPVLCKYNLVAVSSSGDGIYRFYQKSDTYLYGWHYDNFGRELGSLSWSELESMSAEELEEFAVGCSVRSMAPDVL